MKPRAAWPFLSKKAKEKSDQALVALVKGRVKIKGLEQSRDRIEALYADYLVRSIEAEKKSLNIQETENSRGFLQQIQILIKHINVDLQHATFELEVLKGKLLAAEKKRIQMQTLQEQDERRIRDAAYKQEQRDMDAAGVMLFNMK